MIIFLMLIIFIFSYHRLDISSSGHVGFVGKNLEHRFVKIRFEKYTAEQWYSNLVQNVRIIINEWNSIWEAYITDPHISQEATGILLPTLLMHLCLNKL